MRLRRNGKANCPERAFNLLLRSAPTLMPRRIRHICIAVLLAGFIAFSPAWAAGEQAVFLSAIEDVPLMAGLTEDSAATLEFDKPDGRLIETYAYGEARQEDAIAFYTTVMPEFGWRKINDLIYSREGEILRIYLTSEERSLLVRFVLSPDSSR